MSLKALLGTLLALLLAVGGTAFLVARGVQPEPPPPPDIKKGETVYENPFDLKGPGPHPKVVVPENHFEFGVMALGGEQSHVFEFRNEGSGPMRLAKGHVLCKCTIPHLETEEIPPGGSTKITLTWKPVAAEQDFKKEATIWTNDPAKSSVTLSIHGSVYKDPTISPDSFGVGEIEWDKPKVNQATIFSTTSDDLQILGYESSDPKSYELTWTKLSSEELERMMQGRTPKPLVGYTLELITKPNGTIGVFQGWVKLKVNRSESEQQISISGMRSGLIKMHGPDYQASMALLDLKRFKSDQGAKTTLFLRLDSFGEDMKVLDVHSLTGNLTATLTKKPIEGSKKDFYELVVGCKPGVPGGTAYTYEAPDTLTLKTNHPQVPELNFKVRYIAQ